MRANCIVNSLARGIRALRPASGMPYIPGAPSSLLPTRGVEALPPSIWLVLNPECQLGDADRQAPQSFLEANPHLALGHQLKESFRYIVAQGDLELLDAWMGEATQAGLRPFQSLAWGFRKDYQTILLGLTIPSMLTRMPASATSG